MDPTRNFTPQSQRLYNPEPVSTPASTRSQPVRPRTRAQPSGRNPESEPVAKKVFNCIVDDTALVQGAKKSTRDGIPKWIAGEQIRIFVPLYTLDKTARLKDGKGRIATDAEEALTWLDDATSSAPYLVTLQGGYDQYQSWEEVEKFALPKTLFSEGDAQDGSTIEDDLPDRLESSLVIDGSKSNRQSFSSNESFISQISVRSNVSHRSDSPLSPPTSPPKKTIDSVSPKKKGDVQFSKPSTISSSNSGIPVSIRPLFNYIIWRVHQETDPAAALESFIFLCDDPNKRKHAQRFGIRTKSLSDIRYAIAREGQENRNRQLVQKKEAASKTNEISIPTSPIKAVKQLSVSAMSPVLANAEPIKASDSISANGADDSGEDEILFKRTPKAPAAMLTAQSPRGRGKMLDPNQFSRNISGPIRGNPRGNARGGSQRGPSRATSAALGRGFVKQENAGPIDPNSFSRPTPTRGAQRGGRRLWMPT